jgi:hypothetical protein
MPPRVPLSNDTFNHDMILGELRGQVRELVHSVNNLNGKFDALTREVVALGPLAADIASIHVRLNKLEDDSNQQTGALNILKIILTSPVLLGLLVTVAAIWVTVSGKVHIP